MYSCIVLEIYKYQGWPFLLYLNHSSRLALNAIFPTLKYNGFSWEQEVANQKGHTGGNARHSFIANLSVAPHSSPINPSGKIDSTS